MSNHFPSHMPRSLKGYQELYKTEPEKAISRLESHLKKRGPDAVGHYLLSWLHHRSGNRSEAIQAAWRAKICAPGSPVMERLHYFMTHPDSFKAWKPGAKNEIARRIEPPQRLSHPISDLDSLIERLSSIETRRIEFDPEEEAGPDLSKASSQVEDIATETLADIHEQQGRIDLAIATYRKLIELNPEKAEEYRKKILSLREKLDDGQDEGQRQGEQREEKQREEKQREDDNSADESDPDRS